MNQLDNTIKNFARGKDNLDNLLAQQRHTTDRSGLGYTGDNTHVEPITTHFIKASAPSKKPRHIPEKAKSQHVPTKHRTKVASTSLPKKRQHAQHTHAMMYGSYGRNMGRRNTQPRARHNMEYVSMEHVRHYARNIICFYCHCYGHGIRECPFRHEVYNGPPIAWAGRRKPNPRGPKPTWVPYI